MFIIYALEYCHYSQLAIELSKELNLKCKIIEVKQINKQKIKKQNNYQTFPQVFYKHKTQQKKIIGGYNDLQNYMDIISSLNQYNINFNLLKNIYNNK